MTVNDDDDIIGNIEDRMRAKIHLIKDDLLREILEDLWTYVGDGRDLLRGLLR